MGIFVCYNKWMLPKKNKLNTEIYEDIFNTGKSFKTDGFIVKYKDLGNNFPSCAVVVSKKNAKNAIKRNYLRRRVYNEFNKKIPTLPFLAFVLISTKQFVSATKNERVLILENLFSKLQNVK